ncbi:hypothetical protein [Clostridium sp. L74]|uniref:hypothetical protein n=1 Tax=Clostridium sp. L74 TaxID=1560217 RepID=UPI0006ABEA18|nr:hypothetical protein [Clostridium sp. L74]KOR24184.1 hypothetical protein ND00_28900 [Clostridium sp. L74]
MNLYQQRILKGRKQFLRLLQDQEKELLDIYEEASKQISYKLSKASAGSLTARYLNELDKSINRYVLEVRNNLSKFIKDGIETSSQIASAVQLSYLDNIAPTQNIKSSFNKMFAQLSNNTVKQFISGNYYADGKTLDQRIWNLTKRNAADIDRIIKINAAAGTNARDLAKEINKYINPKKKMKIHKRIPGINKSISYQAQRLARTSLTHISTETYIQGSKMNPFNIGLKWNLSPSHYERQVARHGEDICDEYATQDNYDLGSGIYPADKYPTAHPNCICYPIQENIPVEKARDELIAWINGENNPKLDKWLDNYGQEYGIAV